MRAGFVILCAVLLPAVPAPAGAGVARSQDDLDAFMKEVLERRMTNWQDLYRHTARDREVLTVTGPDGEVLESSRREYVWYVREGEMVRSPERVDGVEVSGEERQRAEERWLNRVREERRRRDEKRRASEDPDASGEPLDREHFLGFPFEPGNYYFVGRERLEGRDLVHIEYYPEKLFEDEEDDPEDAEWARRFAKTTRVDLWVLPEERQIVRLEFDNVGLDFLPFRWLVQVDDLHASLVMDRPFPDEDVWLPREIRVHGAIRMATGSYRVEYSLEYFDYKEADVQARVRFRLPRDDR